MNLKFQQKLLNNKLTKRVQIMKGCNQVFYTVCAFASQSFPLNEIHDQPIERKLHERSEAQSPKTITPNCSFFYWLSMKKPKRSYLCGSMKTFTANLCCNSNYCSSFDRTKFDPPQIMRPNKFRSLPMRALTQHNSFKKPIESITIGLASPEQILKWAERVLPNGKIVGQVTSPQTLNYKTLKPEKGGLFCERIFGPVKDYECACGKKKMKSHQRFCNECEVELTSSRVRRYRLGYIQLDSPVTHVWFLKGMSSYISILLNLPRKKVESIAYCTKTISTSVIPSSNNFVGTVQDQTTFKKSLTDPIGFYEIPFINNSNDPASIDPPGFENQEVRYSGSLSIDEAETLTKLNEDRPNEVRFLRSIMLNESQYDQTNSKIPSWVEPFPHRFTSPKPQNNQEPLFLSDYEIQLSEKNLNQYSNVQSEFRLNEEKSGGSSEARSFQPNQVQPKSEASYSVDFVSLNLNEVQLSHFSEDVIIKKFKTNQPKIVFDNIYNQGQTSKFERKTNEGSSPNFHNEGFSPNSPIEQSKEIEGQSPQFPNSMNNTERKRSIRQKQCKKTFRILILKNWLTRNFFVETSKNYQSGESSLAPLNEANSTLDLTETNQVQNQSGGLIFDQSDQLFPKKQRRLHFMKFFLNNKSTLPMASILFKNVGSSELNLLKKLNFTQYIHKNSPNLFDRAELDPPNPTILSEKRNVHITNKAIVFELHIFEFFMEYLPWLIFLDIQNFEEIETMDQSSIRSSSIVQNLLFNDLLRKNRCHQFFSFFYLKPMCLNLKLNQSSETDRAKRNNSDCASAEKSNPPRSPQLNFYRQPKLYEFKQLVTKSFKFHIEMTFSSLIKTLFTDLTYFNVYNSEISQSKSNDRGSTLPSSKQTELNPIVQSPIYQKFQKTGDNSIRVFSKDVQSILKVSLWSSRLTNIENTSYLENVDFKRKRNFSWSKPNFFSTAKNRSQDTRIYKESPFQTILREHKKRQEANSVSPENIGLAQYWTKMKSPFPLNQSNFSMNPDGSKIQPPETKNWNDRAKLDPSDSKNHSAPFNLTKIMKNLVKPGGSSFARSNDGYLRQSNGFGFSDLKKYETTQSNKNSNSTTKEKPLDNQNKFFSNKPVSQKIKEQFPQLNFPREQNFLSTNEHSEYQSSCFPPIIPNDRTQFDPPKEFNFINQINNNFRSYENEFAFLRLFNSIKLKNNEKQLFDRKTLFSNLKQLNELHFPKKESLDFFTSSGFTKKRFQFEPHIDSVLNVFQLCELNQMNLISSPEAQNETNCEKRNFANQLSERSENAEFPQLKTLVNSNLGDRTAFGRKIAALNDFAQLLKYQKKLISLVPPNTDDKTKVIKKPIERHEVSEANRGKRNYPSEIPPAKIVYQKQKLKTIDFLFQWIAYEKPLETEFLLNENKWSKGLIEGQSNCFSMGSMEFRSNCENWDHCTSPKTTSLSPTWEKLSPDIRFNKEKFSFSELVQMIERSEIPHIDSSFSNNFISLTNSLRSFALKNILKLRFKEKNAAHNSSALLELRKDQFKRKSITFQNLGDRTSFDRSIDQNSIPPIVNENDQAELSSILSNEPMDSKSIAPPSVFLLNKVSPIEKSSIFGSERSEITPINEKFLVQPIDIGLKRLIENQSPRLQENLLPIARLGVAQTEQSQLRRVLEDRGTRSELDPLDRAQLDLTKQSPQSTRSEIELLRGETKSPQAHFFYKGGLRSIQLALWSIHLKNNSMLLSLIQNELWTNSLTMTESINRTKRNSASFKIDTWLNILNYLFDLKILSWINKSHVMLLKPMEFNDPFDQAKLDPPKDQKSFYNGIWTSTWGIARSSIVLEKFQNSKSFDRAKLDPPQKLIKDQFPQRRNLFQFSEPSTTHLTKKQTFKKSGGSYDVYPISGVIKLNRLSEAQSPTFGQFSMTSSIGPLNYRQIQRSVIERSEIPPIPQNFVSYKNKKRNKGILLRPIDTFIPSLFNSNEVQITQKVLESEIPKILRIQKAKKQLDQTITIQKELLTKPIKIKSKSLFLSNWKVFRLGKLIERGESRFARSNESQLIQKQFPQFNSGKTSEARLSQLFFDQSSQSYFDIPIERNEITKIEPISLLKKKKLTQNKFYKNLKKNRNNGLEAKSHLLSLLQNKKFLKNTTIFPNLKDNDHGSDPLGESRFVRLDNNILFSYVQNSNRGGSNEVRSSDNKVFTFDRTKFDPPELREKFFDSVLEYKLENYLEKLGNWARSVQSPLIEQNSLMPPGGSSFARSIEGREISPIPPNEILPSSISSNNSTNDRAKLDPPDSLELTERSDFETNVGFRLREAQSPSPNFPSSKLNTASRAIDSNYFEFLDQKLIESDPEARQKNEHNSLANQKTLTDFANRNSPEDLGDRVSLDRSKKDTSFNKLEDRLIENQSGGLSEAQPEELSSLRVDQSSHSSEAKSPKTKSSTSEITLNSNKYYSVLQTQQWESQDHWECFLTYMTENPKKMDYPIFSYRKQALPNQTPLTGGGAIQNLLKNYDSHTHLPLLDKHIRIVLLNLNSQIQELEELLNFEFFSRDLFIKIYTKLCGLRSQRTKILRRLKLIRNFRQSKLHPEWMVLSILPVLPPDLRPIVQLDGNQVGVSDINKLYKLVLVRNQRIKKLRQGIYSINNSIEMRYSQRLLQEGVDALLSTGKVGANSVSGSSKPPLKSLSNILKGKKGRFRQNLLGKRVDYSGRSVIVVGPKLKIHECGLPKEMAIELFQPFLIRRLISQKIVKTVLGAKRLIQAKKPIIWNVLRQVLQNHLILLNRAPTLHRLGIQAFQPKLIEGRAILLHPLVCTAFNADFDGDQMAVHVPLSFQARAEAWKLICSINNLLSPATGQPIVVPSQDMVLGCYYLTTNDLLSESKYTLWTYQQKQAKKELQSNRSEPNLGDRASLDRSGGIDLATPRTRSEIELLRGSSISDRVDQSSLIELNRVSAAHSIPKNPIDPIERHEMNEANSIPPTSISSIPSPFFSSLSSQPKTLLTKDFPFGNVKTSLYGYYFLNFSDVLKKYSENKIDPHMIVWVSWNNDFEDNAQNEQPLEIRIHSIGWFTKIYTKYQASFDLKGQLISQIIRTTAGRVVMNSLINK
uniref:DNA-directed RNA polymerase subunit beta' n=2 Tax=Ignatiaceae TaxID=2682551 RepID=A0A1W6EGS7_9CHLO|nr:beta' subunit of RNA polymerase [Pseudocharacium americanum]YP_009367691.1 beta' subunit of RNA polymerase [Ignatius tetrasporus]ARK14604.1 beta' subunit of RNA polymerase [Pseudocharacium americanum]ARK14693.1 beta' subunit of RNA polymerase [Ignatius tetrasporus]